MRIAFVVERPTQFEAPFFRHAAADPGHHLRVLFTGANPAGEVYDPEVGRALSWGFDLLGGYDHETAPASGLGLGTTRWLTLELRPERCDLAIVNGYTQRPYVIAAAAARRSGVPLALRLDTVLLGKPSPRERLRGLLTSGLLARVYDLFLGVGTLTLDYLRRCGVPEERTGLFPYAVDVEHFRECSRLSPEERAALRERWGVPAGARAVLSVAKLHPREAPWDLLGAFARLAAPDLFLVLAGDGPARPELERFAREHGGGRVRFLGYVPYPELPAHYGAADLFVHPAREERWGVSVAEALACGLPVVASSRVGAAHDLVSPGENGCIYTTGDGAELARRIEEALSLDRSRLAEASRRILSRWDYAASWRGLIAAAERATQAAPRRRS